MADRRLSERNTKIAAMLASGKQLKNFYRFIAQNPYINLHDACQIVIERPNATVCNTMDDWNAMGRRVNKGSKRIPYYDKDGFKHFVFDAADTHGDDRFQRDITPIKRILIGLDELNGTSMYEDGRGDYRKIHNGVYAYLERQGELTGDEQRDAVFAEGITFLLYSKTGFPKTAGINLRGLPYSYRDNAEFVKELYIRAEVLTQEIEEAYVNKQTEVKVIEDTDEEVITDEPVISPVEQTKEVTEEHESAVSPYYKNYLEAQKLNPNGIVVMRLGDFYEVMGENAVKVAKELGITLTGRNVGLPERVPMCGFPYHISDRYIEKILEKHGVILVEDGEEPKYILSHAEALGQGESAEVEAESEQKKPQLIELADEASPFDDEQEEKWDDNDENFNGNDEPEQGEREKEEVNPTPKKQDEKGIQDRKRAQTPQMSMFDLLEPQGKSEREQLIERSLKYGSGIEYGKFRIYDEYMRNPTAKEFADFLKHEYGIGGHGGLGIDNEEHDGKGIRLSYRDENGNTLTEAFLKWPQVAERIADLIDADNYLSEKEKAKYLIYTKEQEEKQRAEGSYGAEQNEPEPTTGADDNAIKVGDKFRLNGREWEVKDFDGLYPEQVVITRTEQSGSLQYGITQNIDIAELLEKGERIEPEQGEPVRQQSKNAINPFSQLSQSDKDYYEKYCQRPYRQPETSIWGEVQNCTPISNGIYSVSTAGHGGMMIDAQLAPHILSPNALKLGDLDGGYYYFEEDCMEAVPLRELYDKGILHNEHEYFKHYTISTENGNIPFADATDEQKLKHIEWWNDAINKSLESWNSDYWRAYKQAKQSQSEGENTDLSAVLDQSGLGGAKTRFKNNVAAIKIVNKLYAEKRNPTAEEQRTLSQFVGWGGLAQAFDEKNGSWSKEYAELKNLLSAEDYEQARSSTLNAYYTVKDVIGGIYSALQRFGVKGNNRILEPAMGTGNFFGFMPKEIAEGASLYGVELDNITGRIAAKLYPQANVQIKGFEDTTFPNDKFDIVVGNVPFGGYGVADSDYNRYNFKVHDYFLAKSVDKVKPGGIVAIITSKGTMDKLNPSARKYVAERAELLGAIRLPNNAFKQTAGTEAVADILFFRKRAEKITDISREEWLGTGKTKEGYEINNYFISHPQMILGTLVEEHGLYGGIDTAVKPDGRELKAALSEAVKNLPQSFYINPQTPPEQERETEVDYNVKPFCYKAENGRLYMRVGYEMVEQAIPKSPKDAYQRICCMIALREELHHILDIQIQGCSDEVLKSEQYKLNNRYDLFVKKYGYLNSQTNTKLFKEDGDSALLFAAENVNEETKAVTKADIFFKRTIRPYVVPTSTDDPFEALQISKNERGRVDIAYIEELTGKDYDTVLSELGNAVFRDPEQTIDGDKYSGFVTNEEYLSGQVVSKLERVRAVTEEHPEYQKNVEALEGVQPEKLTASEISVRLGSTWVDKEYYKQFYCELSGVYRYLYDDVELTYNPHDSSWRLDQTQTVRNSTHMRQKEVYGTNRAPAYRLFVDALNLKATTITDLVEEDGREKRVVNQAETIAAREKQNKIKEEFADWIFKDPKRREELEDTYNRLFNQTRLPSYDGSYLKFPEMNPAIELKPHQKNAVHRIITSDSSTLLHHVVGAGKTFTVIASIMKMRQLGLCKKAMVTVPNHLVQQWAGEWRKLYPDAHILVATKDDLEKNNRRKFVSKVALGDWDGIIIAQSSFAKIPISTERQIRKLQEEIRSVEETMARQWEESGMPRGAVKNLETIKKSKEKQLKKLMDSTGKDDVLKFEDLGIDYLFVDEAHAYKNLFLFTKMNNVAGTSTAASARASDLKLKCEYLQELHGGDRGVVFATGTPISNSMTEMYTMQTYMQPYVLNELGMTFFDGWAANFGETITAMELSPSGQGYRARTRFAKFTNLPELLKLYRSFADVQTADMVKLNVPEAEKKVISLKPSDTVIELAEEIADRADRIHSGSVNPHEDNMLKITSDGKKLALDPRCFMPESQDQEGSKLNECAERIYEVWTDTADKKGTQIVFCDLSTPKVKFEDYEYGKDFDAYNDLKYKLVQRGIPAREIAYIHEANTDEQKQALFDKVNSGAVRVLLGSTEKCGAGTNVQKRLVALHHLDTPYRPSDMEQREGRIIRQGNTNDKVQIFTYVTERTFDSYSYQILENKQRFISQINKGDLTVREAEDIDETTLSYAEIKAITAANPKIKRKMEVDAEVSRLRVLEGQYKKNLYALQDKIYKAYPEEIRKQELLIERIGKDFEMLKTTRPNNPEDFSISVNGIVYTDKKDGGKALMDALYSGKVNVPVAEYCGFKISMNPMSIISHEREITLAAEGQYVISVGDSASGNLTRIENFLNDLPEREERLKRKLVQLKADLEVAKEQVEKPFEQAEQLKALLSEQAELNAELNLDKRDDVIVADENDNGESDNNYRALPDIQKQNAEVNMIDEEDKVAAMQVDLLPDYAVTNEDMHAHGYTWDGMLPVTGSAAKTLSKAGVQIYELRPNDTEAMADTSLFDEKDKLFGVEKPEWLAFLRSDNGRCYIIARRDIVKSVLTPLDSEDMQYFSNTERDKLWEQYGTEVVALDKAVNDGDMPSAADIKKYALPVFDEQVEKLKAELPFEEHGWGGADIHLAVYGNVEDVELKGVLQEYSLEIQRNNISDNDGKYFPQYEDNPLGLPPLDDELTVLAVQPDIGLNENQTLKGAALLKNEAVDGWYILGSSNDGKGNELKEGDKTNLEQLGISPIEFDPNIIRSFNSEQEAQDFFNEKVQVLNSVKENYERKEPDYEEEVINSVNDEFDAYKADVLSRPPEEIFLENYKIHVFTELTVVINEGVEDENGYGYLDIEHYKALYEERGGILNALYDDFVSNDYASVHNYQDTADFIKEYCESYHSAVMSGETKMPVYLKTSQYALEHGEDEEYNASCNVSRECRDAIDKAISENFDGTHLKDGWINEIIDRYGEERVRYIFATTLRENLGDGRYSPENKGWAENIPISECQNERRNCCLYSHPAVIDGVVRQIRKNEHYKQFLNAVVQDNEERQQKEETDLAENKYLKETSRGDEVLSITQDKSGRNIAVVRRKKDFTVALGYDTTDGTWAQGIYDFKDEKAANDYREKYYGETSEPKDKWYEIFVSKEALIKTYDKSSLMRMPSSNREYADYTFFIYNNRIKDSRQLVDMQSDSRELCYKISLSEGEVVNLCNRDGDEVELTAKEFAELVNHTSDKDYVREQKPRVAVNIPKEALIKTYDNSSLYRAPNGSKYAGYAYYLPNSVVGENTQTDDGSMTANLAEDFTVTLRKDKEEIKVSAQEFKELVGNTSADDYKREPTALDDYRSQNEESGKKWHDIDISNKAVIAEYEESTLFKMPKDTEHEGYVYYIPNSLIQKGDNGGMALHLPEDFVVRLKMGSGQTIELSLTNFENEINGMDDEDYENIYRRPSDEAREKFERVESNLRKNLPEEMLNKPNWVVVRTKENKDKGKLDKFLINVHTGKFAESDNPETWTDFDTACEYAKENGGVALAYALDGKDGISCIDLDKCIDEKGTFSDLATEVINTSGRGYTEKSVSGNGLHIFGRTKGADLRSFSKDGDMEYYQGGQFIAMTGDNIGGKELMDFDTPEMKALLERKLERRTEWKNVGKGEAGLTQMDDRELFDKAFSARNGDTVRRLYNGEDLRNNHSNSDMSLMNYLAFYSGGNIEQMTRIFATSGLYRREKPQSYYEYTAIKAAKDTPHYTPPKAPAAAPKSPKSSDGNSKA